jgi:hypothetical protein
LFLHVLDVGEGWAEQFRATVLALEVVRVVVRALGWARSPNRDSEHSFDIGVTHVR